MALVKDPLSFFLSRTCFASAAALSSARLCTTLSMLIAWQPSSSSLNRCFVKNSRDFACSLARVTSVAAIPPAAIGSLTLMASDGPSLHSPSLRLGLPAPQPSRRHHAQSLLGPSFHDSRTHHVLESHPERAAPLSRRDDERCHAIISHSALALRLYLAAYNTSSSCRF